MTQKLNLPNHLYSHAEPQLKHVSQNINIPHERLNTPTMRERYFRWRSEMNAHSGIGWSKYFISEILKELEIAKEKQHIEAKDIKELAKTEALDRLIKNDKLIENLDYLQEILAVLQEWNQK